MGKAKGDHTPDAAIPKMVAPEQPPHGDPRWGSIEAAHKCLTERFGDTALATIELMKALADGRLPCMARSRRSGEPRQVASAEWVDEIELLFWKNRLRVFSRRPSVRMVARRPTPVREQIRDWVFFVWQPAFDRILRPPADSAPLAHDDDSDEPPPRSQASTPQQRTPRKQGGGRRPKFEPGQLAWLRQRYHVAVKADPLLAKHEAAVPHVKELAKTEYAINAERDTLLDQIVRPVLAYSSMEK